MNSVRGLEQFRSAVEELETIQQQLASVAKEQGCDWRRELIDLRRKLQMQIGVVAAAIGNTPSLSRDSERGPALSEALSKMRSALALHQANWPAVSIDPASFQYAQSTATVRAANRAFIDLVREALADTGARPITRTFGSEK